jgi:RecA-family ATPase
MWEDYALTPSEILSRDIVEPEWVVKGMIPRGNMVIWAGGEGAGKSYTMYNLTYAIGCGKPFLGHATNPSRVVYFDEENSEPDFLKYNQWAWRAHGAIDPNLLTSIRLEHYSLLNGWHGAMRAIIKEHKPDLVIIDTATPAFHLQDENDNAEANRVIIELRRIRGELAPRATFIVLKHERQRDERGHRRTIRGAKTWLGAFDQVIYHVVAPGARRRKDGTRMTVIEPDKLRAFGLSYRIGIDPCFDGPERNTLILNTFQPREGKGSDD